MYQETGLVCIDTSSAVPVSNLYRHVLKVLAEASYLRRTIWVKAKMPGTYFQFEFQNRLREYSSTYMNNCVQLNLKQYSFTQSYNQ